MSEKVLGIIQGMGYMGGTSITEILFFTPYRVIVAETSSTSGWLGTVFGPVAAGIDAVRSWKKMEKKGKEYLALPVEDILKADKNNFDVPYSEITKVELKKTWRGRVEMKMQIMDEEMEGETHWGKWYGLGIPEKENTTIEDYENILRPIFGDKLSVKK